MVENKKEYFEKIAGILTTILKKIDEKTDVVWAGYNTPQELIDHLNAHIEAVKACDFEIPGT